jgi:hypothetical protein
MVTKYHSQLNPLSPILMSTKIQKLATNFVNSRWDGVFIQMSEGENPIMKKWVLDSARLFG